MNPDAPSRTSILVAAARAFASRDPDENVRNPDALADALIGPDELALISEHPISAALMQPYADASENPAVVMFAWLMLLRTRFIDEALLRAVENGATQLVILGAGFDTRAFRFRELLKDCRVVELDAVVTQNYKRRRIGTLGWDVPPNLTYCSIDFTEDDLPDVLRVAGIQKDQKTFFLWEGVSMYVGEAGVRRTLGSLGRNSAAGSSLVMDYANQQWFEHFSRHAGFQMASAWGEPWIFGVPDPDGREFFRQLGFEPLVLVSLNNPELVRRYSVRRDGTLFGSKALQKIRQPAGAPRPRDVYWVAELGLH